MQISVSSARKEIEIIRDGQNVGSVYFSPSDTAILTRFKEVQDKAQEILSHLSEDVNVDNFAEISRDVDKKLRDLVDYAFDYPCADVVFGNSFAFTTANGISMLEQFLDGAVKYINAELSSETKAAQKRQDKYLAKYQKK